jgi:hypothetical protein
MKIILSKQCESLTGMLNSSLGYHIEHRKNGFFSKRNQRGIVPPDGHWRFILTCAELAQNKLHIADIRVSREELKQAMYEARIFIAMQHLRKDLYDARDIINLKITFSL